MLSSQFNELFSEIKFTTSYLCSECGVEEPGTTERVSINVRTPTELARALENRRQTSAHMPRGWGFSGVFRCPDCLKTNHVE